MSRIILLFAVLATACQARAADASTNVPPPQARLVVANFRAANGDTFTWNGIKESTAMWTATVADRLTERLVQARRFVMLDRKFDAEVKDELTRLSDKNASKDDAVRLGRRLGADYLIAGEAKFFPAGAAPTSPVTGQALPTAPRRFADVSFRMVRIATGELVAAESVSLNSDAFRAADMATFVSSTTDCAAQLMANAVMTALFPNERADACPASAPAATQTHDLSPAALATPVRGTAAGGIVTPF